MKNPRQSVCFLMEKRIWNFGIRIIVLNCDVQRVFLEKVINELWNPKVHRSHDKGYWL
jgi:hypothetical protein